MLIVPLPGMGAGSLYAVSPLGLDGSGRLQQDQVVSMDQFRLVDVSKLGFDFLFICS